MVYLASIWVCVVPPAPASPHAPSSVWPAPVASSGTMSSSALRSEHPTRPGQCTFHSGSAATWLCVCVCVQSLRGRCKKCVLESAPGCRPCSWALLLAHSPHTLITEQQPAAGQAVGVKNDKLQHLETICLHSGAFIARFARLHCQFIAFGSSWIFLCSYSTNFSCLPFSLSFSLSLLICLARFLFSKAVWDSGVSSNMLFLLLKWEGIPQKKSPTLLLEFYFSLIFLWL